MWTPKRILMLAFGMALFFSGYLVYGRFLGGIDGLPPLPPYLCTRANPEDHKVPPAPRSLGCKNCLRRPGKGCTEWNRPIQLELNRKAMLLAADTCVIENGKLRLEPMSVALFGKDKKRDQHDSLSEGGPHLRSAARELYRHERPQDHRRRIERRHRRG